jgi:mannose-1-phosphate guanylyltransferase
MQYGVIMAGGAGTRLWPLSRKDRPKQLLPVVRGKSLLQLSYERLRGLLPPDRIFVCTGAAHGQAVLDNLPELPKENLLGEPAGRDTANAVGFPAAVLHQRDKDAVTAVVTADHVIAPVEKFQTAIKTAFEVVEAEPQSLVTFGIVPSYGHTGLGYIHRGESLAAGRGSAALYRVLCVQGKPDKATGRPLRRVRPLLLEQRHVRLAGRHGADEWQQHLPQSYRGLEQIAQTWDDRHERDAVPQRGLPRAARRSASTTPSWSRPARGRGKGSVWWSRMPVQWLDVGSWPAWPRRCRRTSTTTRRPALQRARRLRRQHRRQRRPGTPGHHVGISDMIIVHTRDATMVCPKSEAQRVKELVAKVKEKYGERYQ